MTRIEREFYLRTKKYFPTATMVELNNDRFEPNLYIFFKAGENEFGIDETKVIRMLKAYSMVGEEVFDAFLTDIEELYTVLSLPGNAKELDFRFLIV